jgi:hypothetical protein
MPLNNNTIQFPFSHADMQVRVKYNAAGDVEYIGRAKPGVSESDDAWLIAYIGYDSSRNITSLKFAGGDNAYKNAWSRCDHYSYS